MEYVIGEILLCLLAVALISSLIGWLLHSVLGQGKFSALESVKNRQIEALRGELETSAKARQDTAAKLDKANLQMKDLETKLAASAQQLLDAKSKHETALGQVQQRLTALETVVAERESRLEAWQSRFDGLVEEKDKTMAAGLADLNAHKSKLTAMGISLAAVVAEKDALHAKLDEHQEALESTVAAKDVDIAGLRTNLTEAVMAKVALQTQFDDQQKALASTQGEKDAHIASLGAKLAEATTLETQHQKSLADGDAKLADLHAKLTSSASQLEEYQKALDAANSTHTARLAELNSKLDEAGSANAALQQHQLALQGTHSESIADLQSKLAAAEEQKAGKLYEMTTLLSQRDEQLRSFDQRMRGAIAEKDTVIGKLRAMVSQLEPLRHEIQLRDEANEHIQKKITELQSSQFPGSGLEEAQRQLHASLALNASLRIALEGKDSEIAAFAVKSATSSPLADRLSDALAEKEKAFAALDLQLKQGDAAHQDLIQSHQERTAFVESQAISVAGRHAAAQSEIERQNTHSADLESRLRSEADQHQAALRTISAKQEELDHVRAQLAQFDTQTVSAVEQLKARIAQLEQSLTDELPVEARLRGDIRIRESEIAELRAQIALRDDHLAETGIIHRQQFATAVPTAPAVHDSAAPSGGDHPQEERLNLLENQVLDVTVRHAAAKSEIEDWSSKFANLEAQSRQIAAEHEAATRAVENKQIELDKARAEVSNLDQMLMTIPALETERADLRAQLVDRDERLEAWDSRFHASIGELRGEIGDLTARLHAQDAELHKLHHQAPAATMAAAAGFAGGLTSTTIHRPSTASQRDEDGKRLAELFKNISLHGVQFLPSSAELIPQSLPILAQASDALHRFPDVSVEIAGHTDSWGTPEENLDLSHRRAGAVKEYLVNSGIAAWRLTDLGYGHTRPIDSNDTADGRFANRRIEFAVR